jgi:ketosteroid isomerase-like protein
MSTNTTRRSSMLSLLLAGTAAAAAPEAVESLKQADLDFCQATKARGLDGWMSYFADDATGFPPDKPLINGKAALREYYSGMFARPGFQIDWRPVQADVAVSNDLGYTIGTAEFEWLDKDGKRVESTGKYLTVWKKQPNGKWLVVADLGN